MSDSFLDVCCLTLMAEISVSRAKILKHQLLLKSIELSIILVSKFCQNGMLLTRDTSIFIHIYLDKNITTSIK